MKVILLLAVSLLFASLGAQYAFGLCTDQTDDHGTSCRDSDTCDTGCFSVLQDARVKPHADLFTSQPIEEFRTPPVPTAMARRIASISFCLSGLLLCVVPVYCSKRDRIIRSGPQKPVFVGGKA